MESKYVLTRCGDDLLSVTVDTPAEAQAVAAQIRNSGSWVEVVPGIASVLVCFDAAVQDGEEAQRVLEQILAGDIPALPTSGDLIEIPVVYGGPDGPDFEFVCKATDLSAEELVALHTGGEYTVDMIGFTPGFAFVGGLDDRLRIPRREEPRLRVAAGSVGIADGRTGLYAMSSPGGWNIIGQTPARLFNPDAENPFVLRAGMRVRFKAVDAGELDA